MTETTRRELLVVAAGATLASAPLAQAATKKRKRKSNGKRVAVLGGGMAGLTAAHELVERGFEVHVYERNALGGKARSIPVPGTAAGGRRPLPGEHGFRFFPGFYHHVPDSMRRTPFPGNANGVWDNLVSATDTVSPRTNGRADGTIFGVLPNPAEALTPEGLRRVLLDLATGKGLRPDELEFFVNRLLVFATSCDERRFGEWEHVPWREFVRAEGKSEEYRKVISAGLTRAVVAAKESVASTRTIGNMGEAFVFNIVGRGNDGAPDRILSGPTNEAWIDPWVVHLRKLGVHFHVGQTIEALRMNGRRVESARARDRRGRRRAVEADYFLAAMPPERARKLWSSKVLAVDERLALMDELFVDWMSGIQFYLKRDIGLVRGHLTFVDSPWALTGLTQAQFWSRNDFARDYGDGTAVDCLSIDVSDWDAPGILYGKPAKKCTREQIKNEVWAQLKAHVNDNGSEVLRDADLHSWFLDPGIAWVKSRQENRNDTPLLVNTVGSWEKRPKARTKIPNLFLAGDYVQTNIDLATMEGANESGRAAVIALMDTAGSQHNPPKKYKLWREPLIEEAKNLDKALYRNGQPNLLDHHP